MICWTPYRPCRMVSPSCLMVSTNTMQVCDYRYEHAFMEHGANCIQLWVSRPVRKHPSPSLFLIPIPPSYPHLLFRRVSTVRECDMSVSISMVKERGTDNRTKAYPEKSPEGSGLGEDDGQ